MPGGDRPDYRRTAFEAYVARRFNRYDEPCNHNFWYSVYFSVQSRINYPIFTVLSTLQLGVRNLIPVRDLLGG